MHRMRRNTSSRKIPEALAKNARKTQNRGEGDPDKARAFRGNAGGADEGSQVQTRRGQSGEAHTRAHGEERMAKIEIELEKFTEKPKEREEVLHRFESAIGWCSACRGVETREPEKLIEKLPAIVPKLREMVLHATKEKSYVCANCGTGIADDREEAQALSNCLWCTGANAIKRENHKK